jgi:biopolymer transport protein ExbD
MPLQMNKKRITAFNAISLTDIVLLLLIFFLLSSSFIIQPGIKVKLPKAAAGEVEKVDQIAVTLLTNQQLYLNQEQISKSDLGSRIRPLLAKNPQRVVVLRAEKDVRLENAVEIIDIAKLAGADRFVIATQPIQ